MKHLKTYNESIDDNILQDIKDILLELDDFNLYHSVNKTSFSSKSWGKGDYVYQIKIKGPSIYNGYRYKDFKWPDVSETMLRLLHFFRLNKIHVSSFNVNDNNYGMIVFQTNQKLFYDDYKINDIEIYFY